MRAVLTTARRVTRRPTENLYLMLASMSFGSVHTGEVWTETMSISDIFCSQCLSCQHWRLREKAERDVDTATAKTGLRSSLLGVYHGDTCGPV